MSRLHVSDWLTEFRRAEKAGLPSPTEEGVPMLMGCFSGEWVFALRYGRGVDYAAFCGDESEARAKAEKWARGEGERLEWERADAAEDKAEKRRDAERDAYEADAYDRRGDR